MLCGLLSENAVSSGALHKWTFLGDDLPLYIFPYRYNSQGQTLTQ